jgi:hypothetical protein
MSNDKSEEINYTLQLDNLHAVCDQFIGNAEEMLAFNEDVFTILK